MGGKGKENREAEDQQQLSQKKEKKEKSLQDDARRAWSKETILSGTKILRLGRKMQEKYSQKRRW